MSLDAVTLIVATQRSGSTLLCGDIENLGGMGRPREYFLPILDKSVANTLSESDVLETFTKGEMDSAPGIGAVKIMVNYAPRINGMLYSGHAPDPLTALENIFNWTRNRFKRVNLVTILREDVLDQAISRIVARQTKIYHIETAGAEKAGRNLTNSLSVEHLYSEILAEISTVLYEQKILKKFIARNVASCLTIGYNELASDVNATSEAIIAHARSHGFQATQKSSNRKFRKVIAEVKSKEIKAGFKAYLEETLRLWI